jgi:cell division protein FtsB
MSLETLARARNGSSLERRSLSRAAHSLLPSLYLGFFLYCALSFLFGPAGILAYSRLEARNEAMAANLKELSSLRDGLNAELESLKTDPDRAAREARSLGYLRKGEGAIILGERNERPRPIATGRVLPYAEPASLSDLALKEISLGFSLALMALLLAPGFHPRPGRPRP